MTLLKEIGAILGFVAFGGLAVLVFLTFQQARHLRRLREWAGRAPERAAIEADRVAAAAEEASAAGDPAHSPVPEESGPGRLERFRGEAAYRYEELDRRSPMDPRLLLGAIVAVLLGVGIATSGFGLLGGGGAATEAQAPGSGSTSTKPKRKVKVAVLNGTAPEGGVGVSGIAEKASKDVKAMDGYKVGAVATAGSYPTSVIMFEDGSKSDAKSLESDLEDRLGQTELMAITPDIEALADGAPLALVIGQDDQGI